MPQKQDEEHAETNAECLAWQNVIQSRNSYKKQFHYS
jgi:hypothetical protein